MVTTGQILGMILAIVIPMAAVVVLQRQIMKKLKKKGIFTCFVYGMLGYCWQMILYAFVHSWVVGFLGQYDFFKAGFGYILAMMINAIVYAFFVVLATSWCLYLANMRIREFDRGVPIGVGYAAAYIFWSYLFAYGIALFYGIQIKTGSFQGSDEIKEKIFSLSVENMYLYIADMIIFLLIMAGTLVLMSHFFTKGEKGKMILVPLLSQYVINFLDSFLPYMLPEVASSIIYHLVTGTMAVYGLWLIYGYIKSGRLELLPGRKTSEE